MQRFLFYTTLVLSLITTTEAFQITKLFSQSEKKDKVVDMASEQTFIAVKPDGVMRGLVGEIIGRFEKRGYGPCLLLVLCVSCFGGRIDGRFKLVALKMVHASKEHLEQHCMLTLGCAEFN